MHSLCLGDRVKADVVGWILEGFCWRTIILHSVSGGEFDWTYSRDISGNLGAVTVCDHWQRLVRVDVASSVTSVSTGFLRKSALSIYGGRERRHLVRRRERAWTKGKTQVPESTRR